MGYFLLATALSLASCPKDCEGLFLPPRDTAPVPPGHATEPDVSVSITWLALQLVPNVGLGLGERGAHLRMSWQVTPLLYSFATDPRLSRFRFFIAEPIVRHAGSIELVASPEYVGYPERFAERFGYRVAVRSTFGLIQRGDYLSLSLATGYLKLQEGESAEYEVGLYMLFGNLGVTAQFAPNLERTMWTASLRLRFF